MQSLKAAADAHGNQYRPNLQKGNTEQARTEQAVVEQPPDHQGASGNAAIETGVDKAIDTAKRPGTEARRGGLPDEQISAGAGGPATAAQ
jgi:hypothetical protein